MLLCLPGLILLSRAGRHVAHAGRQISPSPGPCCGQNSLVVIFTSQVQEPILPNITWVVQLEISYLYILPPTLH